MIIKPQVLTRTETINLLKQLGYQGWQAERLIQEGWAHDKLVSKGLAQVSETREEHVSSRESYFHELHALMALGRTRAQADAIIVEGRSAEVLGGSR